MRIVMSLDVLDTCLTIQVESYLVFMDDEAF